MGFYIFFSWIIIVHSIQTIIIKKNKQNVFHAYRSDTWFIIINDHRFGLTIRRGFNRLLILTVRVVVPGHVVGHRHSELLARLHHGRHSFRVHRSSFGHRYVRSASLRSSRLHRDLLDSWRSRRRRRVMLCADRTSITTLLYVCTHFLEIFTICDFLLSAGRKLENPNGKNNDKRKYTIIYHKRRFEIGIRLVAVDFENLL